jgi:5-methyltetrahydrofolate--homocysteine methyltransferase
MSSLLSAGGREAFVARTRDEQARVREQHAERARKPLLTLERARANRLAIDWAHEDLPVPAFLGTRRVEVPLDALLPFIDWTFFFNAWELKGRVPAIFEHPKYGDAARDLYENAQALLTRIVSERSLTADGVYGFWPAGSEGDDLVLFADESRSTVAARFPMLRQQEVIADAKPNRSLADFVAPVSSGRRDYLGAFAVTAGIGADALVDSFERDLDDYHAIMVKALADRLAEAFAER